MYSIDHRRCTGMNTHHILPYNTILCPSALQLRSSRGPVSRGPLVAKPGISSILRICSEPPRWTWWVENIVLKLFPTNEHLFYHQAVVKMHSGYFLAYTQAIPSILECPLTPNRFATKKNRSEAESYHQKKTCLYTRTLPRASHLTER